VTAVPSQIVNYLDDRYPQAKQQMEGGGSTFYLEISHAPPVQHLLSMVESLPSHLLNLDSDSYAEFEEAIAAIRFAIDAWSSGNNTYKLKKVPNRQKLHPFTLLRKNLVKLKDEGMEHLEQQEPKPVDRFVLHAQQSRETWVEIENEYGLTKRGFGKKINFIKDEFRRKIIFRDVEQAYILAKIGFFKPSIILSGSVIEELLRHYLCHKRINPSDNTFNDYIKACKDNVLLKSAIQSLTDSIRHFRNHVHLAKEKNARDTISKSNAKGAVASIFTIANAFD
jgi:hypothetical protein